uniref:uncharacterized protein LOC105349424 isoform X2 n=1 Tax=Fragaria vesca subsp. vesca TaxID=101020 RepID=UPI0005C98C74|nr:PREDICTED: uncharacterized protein LOC105349424 isoform X2 [Fragaria vesca subsp. vesca]
MVSEFAAADNIDDGSEFHPAADHWIGYLLLEPRKSGKEEVERRIGQSYCISGRGMNLRFISSFGSFGRRLPSPSLERLGSFFRILILRRYQHLHATDLLLIGKCLQAKFI